MRSIELQTTQNVTINYELAPLRGRVFAFILDVIFLLIIIWIVSYGIMGLMLKLDLADEFIAIVVGPFITFYTLIFESLNRGRTPGKMILRTQVVRVDGKKMKFTDYLLRWVFRLLDIWFSFGAIGVIMISSSKSSQRLGGMLSNSAVVKSNPKLQLSLKDILKINTTSERTPKYREVRHFREEDMLVVKQTIERYQRYRNKAHKEAVVQLVDLMCEKLEIEQRPEDPIEFLRDIIKDYIVLTR